MMVMMLLLLLFLVFLLFSVILPVHFNRPIDSPRRRAVIGSPAAQQMGFWLCGIWTSRCSPTSSLAATGDGTFRLETCGFEDYWTGFWSFQRWKQNSISFLRSSALSMELCGVLITSSRQNSGLRFVGISEERWATDKIIRSCPSLKPLEFHQFIGIIL